MLGIDISASSIKLVELGQDKSGAWVLERCAIEPLEKGCVADGSIEKFDEVVDALRRAVKKSGSKAKQVALALPHAAVITKRIVLPAALGEQELELHVESEASQYIPFSLDEVSLDFCVLGPNAKNTDDVDVLLAASRKEKVGDRQGLAEAVGLQAAVLDIETHAARLAAARLIAKLPLGGRDALVALVKVGGSFTSLQVVRNDELLFEREQSFGGAQLTQMLSKHYGFSWEEAESKKRAGELPEDYAAVVQQPFVDGLATEVARALQFFFTSTPYHKVQQILIFGGSAGLAGIAQTMTSHTSTPAVIANPFLDMHMGSEVRKTRMMQEAPAYLTACGLAMRRFLQ
jgi:type IV pilus assembly protein PilM